MRNTRSYAPAAWAVFAALAMLLLVPGLALAAEAPQLAWPGQTGEIIKRLTPIAALLVVGFGLFSIVSAALGGMSKAAGGGTNAPTIRSAIQTPVSVTVIALITIVVIYGFLDIINAALAWIYSFI